MTKTVKTIKNVRGVFGQIIKWTFILFNILMLVWLFGYWSSIAPLMDTDSDAGQAGAAIGSFLGTGMILVIWTLGAIVLGIFVLLTKGKKIIVEEGKNEDIGSEKKPRRLTGIISIACALVFIFYIIGSDSQGKSSDSIETQKSEPKVAQITQTNQKREQKKNSGSWFVHRDQSEMDDTPTISVSKKALSPAQVWLKKITPSLTIRCKENETDVILNISSSFTPVYGQYNKAQIRIRIDDKKPSSQYWVESTDNEAAFSPKPISLLRQMKDAKRLRIEFYPFNETPTTAEFDLEGLRPHLEEVAKTCNWKL
jgi:invasion protein IalB